MDYLDDGRPMETDVFLVYLLENCDDHWDFRHGIKAWVEGDWDEAMKMTGEVK